jgi:hypothetical protein
VPSPKLKAAVLIGWLALGTGCTSTFRMPANRFEYPETRGSEGFGRIEAAGLTGGNSVTYAKSRRAAAGTDPTQVLATSYAGFLTGVGVRVTDNFDIGGRLQNNAPLVLRLNYQLLGEPAARKKTDGFSVSLLGAGGYGLGNETSSSSGTISTYSTSFYTGEGGLVAGYRITKSILVYVGGYYSFYGYSAALTEEKGSTAGASPSPEPSSSTGSSKSVFNGTATQPGFYLGVQIDLADVFIKIEIAQATLTVSGTGTPQTPATTTTTAGATEKKANESSGFFPGLLLGARF